MLRKVGRAIWARIIKDGEWQLVALALLALALSAVFELVGIWKTSTRFLFWMGVLAGLGFYLAKSRRDK